MKNEFNSVNFSLLLCLKILIKINKVLEGWASITTSIIKLFLKMGLGLIMSLNIKFVIIYIFIKNIFTYLLFYHDIEINKKF